MAFSEYTTALRVSGVWTEAPCSQCWNSSTAELFWHVGYMAICVNRKQPTLGEPDIELSRTETPRSTQNLD